MVKKNKKTESSALGIIIAAICIVIYLGALIQAAVRIYLSLEEHKITADQEFAYISNVALNAGQSNFMDERFIALINNALLSSRSIEAVIISGPEGEYAFERQKDRTVTWVNNSPRFINRFGLSTQAFYKPLPVQDLRNVNIRAAASSFNHAEITKILRETVFLIMIGFSLAFFTLVIQALLASPKKENEQTATSAVKDEAPAAFAKQDAASDKEIDPKGLYSPRSNIGWEEYLNDRLESELHRCSSSEKDLTLFFIEFFNGIGDQQFRYATEEAVSIFSSRDLLFERGKNGIAVIDPGTNLEAALAKAKKLYQRFKEKIFIYDPTGSFSIGISSRSGRLVNADRMLFETNVAVKKAKADKKTPIIAFKSNLDKYREFVSKKAT